MPPRPVTEKVLKYCYFYLVCEAIGTAVTPGLLCQPRLIVNMIAEKQMECRLAGETEVPGENLPQRHQNIPHDQTRVWTRAAAVGSRSYGAVKFCSKLLFHKLGPRFKNLELSDEILCIRQQCKRKLYFFFHLYFLVINFYYFLVYHMRTTCSTFEHHQISSTNFSWVFHLRSITYNV
jgi:hypothetical protein